MNAERPMRGAARTSLVLAVFVCLFILLSTISYTRTSATWDEPLHLTGGYMALKFGDFRFGIVHPHLVRMWAALPLVLDPTVHLDRTTAAYFMGNHAATSRQFTYLENDADRMLYRARFMIVLLTAALGVLLFFWARDLYGFATAAAILAIYCLDPNILAHGSLVTTDMGVALFFFAASYALWRMARRLTPWNLLAFVVCFALAQVSKYTAILLGPGVFVVLCFRAASAAPWPWRLRAQGVFGSRKARMLVVAAVCISLLAVTCVTVWGVYGFRFATYRGDVKLQIAYDPTFQKESRHPGLAAIVTYLDRKHLLPDDFAQSYYHLLGSRESVSSDTWWYFLPASFPVKKPSALLILPGSFLVKTPTALLILLMAAGWLGFRRAGLPWRERLPLLAPPIFFLGGSILFPGAVSHRHLLPLYPFLMLAAGIPLSRLLAGRFKALLIPLALLFLVEFAVIYPDCLAAFNLPSGGPGKGQRWLLDSALDWGQDLKGLKKWMDRHGVGSINLNYYGSADPRYYGIDAVYLPGSLTNETNLPRLPGYVAVSLTNLYSIRGGEDLLEFYRPLAERKPVAVIGRSINVYWVDSPWWIPQSDPSPRR